MKLPRPALVAAASIPMAVFAMATPAGAQVNRLPAGLIDVGIEEHPGAVLPRDVELTDQDGRVVRLGDYFDGERPLVLVFAYYRCPMLCSMVQEGLATGLKELAWDAGNRYRVLTVSFDPNDTPAAAKEKRDGAIAAYGRAVPAHGWDFAVGREGEVRRLADAVGFKYKYDPAEKQYAHGAGAFVVTPDGRLSRTLYGMRFPEQSLRLALVEASQGKLGGAFDKVVLFCFHYDPQVSAWVVGARRTMQLGGVLTVAILALFLVRQLRGAQPLPPSAKVSEDPV